MAEGQELSPIEDGYNDIAKRASTEQMRTNAIGRRPFQVCYLVSSTSLNRASNVQYDPKSDCHTVLPKLPKEKELQMADNTKQYLEVGLIHGKEPDRYIATGTGRNKKREHDRERRGVMDRDEFAIRVFTPITTNIKPQCKFYVGCSPVDDRLSPKLIQADRIYFYPEFWLNINVEKTTAKERLSALCKACRKHAAQVQEEEKRVGVLIVADDEAKARAAHPSITTSSSHRASILTLQYAMYQETNNAQYIAEMRDTIKNAIGCVGYGPDTSTEGVFALLDTTEPFSAELALKAKRELETHAGLRVEASFLAELHIVLMALGPDALYPLESRTLDFFLRYYKELEGPEVTEEGVKRALRATVIHGQTAPPISTASNVTYNGEKGEMKIGDFHHILACIDQALLKLQEFSKRSTIAVAEQHGGILRHKSIGELMAKIATAVDKTAIQGLMSELAALDATTSQRQLNEVVQAVLDKLRHYIGALMSRSKREGDDEGDD